MKKHSLDSSFIISYLSKKEIAGKFLEELEYDTILLPSIAELEVKWGKSDISKFENLDKIRFGKDEVETVVEMKKHLELKGEMINRLDIMIAAQSYEQDTTLITGDRDFKKLDDFQNFESVNFREAENE